MALSHQWRLQPPYSAAALNTSGLGLGCLGVFNGASETLVGRRRLSPPSVRAAGRVTYSKGIATLYDNSLYTQFPPGAIRSIDGEFTIGAWIHPTAFQLYSSIFDNSDSTTVNGLELRLGAGASGPTGAVPSLFKKNSGGYNEWAAGISPSVNADNCIIYSSNGLLEDSGSFVINNVETTSTTQGHTNTGMIAPSSNNFYVGTRSDVYTKFTGGIYLVAVWSRILSAKEKADFYWNPWQIFAPIRRQFYFGVAASGITGALGATLADAALAATGAVAVAGAATPTLNAATLTATGALAISGTASVTLDAATLTATGAAGVTGTAAVTLDTATVAATGTLAIAGTTTQTLADATAAGTGALAITGTLTGTLDAATLAATGVLGTITTGALAATLADATLAATGTVAIAGTTTQSLAAATLAATGTLPITGATTATLDAATVIAAGNIKISGTLAQTLADAALAATGGAGTIRIGALAVTLADATMAARMYPSSAGPIGSMGPLHRPPEARRAKQAAERRPPNRR